MRELIAELINAEELLSARSILKEIDVYLTDNTAKRPAACKALLKAMRERAAHLMHIYTLDRKPYSIYRPHFSVPLFLMSFGLSGKSGVKEVRGGIAKLIEFIDEYVTAPSGRCLTEEQAKAALAEVMRLYPYFEIVGKGRPLPIINLANTNRKYNSLCAMDANGANIMIVMFNLKPGEDGDCSPVAVFLHELGHALHISITGSEEVPPEFYQFQSVFSNKLAPGDPMAGEVFADTFALSVMHGGPLQSHMPFEVDAIVAEMVKRFYKGLFQKYAGNGVN